MKLDLILRIGVKLILPFILLFALYVHFHGDYGPGGGFQAGVIGAAGVILYGLIFGVDAAKRVVPLALVQRMVPLGVLIYVSTGIVGMLGGYRFLDYTVFSPHHSAHGHEYGIILVESGVIITVFSTMTAIFYYFAERGRS
jgi:multicomponent Na+:H+ antiporter subunit B